MIPPAEYSVIDRLLHRAALGNSVVPDLALDLERSFYGEGCKPREGVYVLGLARSGSTALTRALYSTGGFGSLTYADMPFVTAPNLWHSVARFGRRRRSLVERAHADGVLVDFDSPDAFEEVFWRMKCGDAFIHADRLRAHSVSEDVVFDLQCLQSLVCRRYGTSRYLAKNNNQILRIASLSPQTPGQTYLIIFRDPAAQAASLLGQHLRFSRSDAFTRRYMEWLVHHEFGATHRPFHFPGDPPAHGSPANLDYWILRWTEAYSHLLSLLKGSRYPNLVAVEYESLCNDPVYRRRLFDRLSCKDPGNAFRSPARSIGQSPCYFANSTIAAAESVRGELSRIAQRI